MSVLDPMDPKVLEALFKSIREDEEEEPRLAPERVLINHPMVGRNIDLQTISARTLTDLADSLGVIRQLGETDVEVRARIVKSMEVSRRFKSPAVYEGDKERAEFKKQQSRLGEIRKKHAWEEQFHRMQTALKDIGAIVRAIEKTNLHDALFPDTLEANIRDIKRSIVHGLGVPKPEPAEKPATGFLAGLEEIDGVE